MRAGSDVASVATGLRLRLVFVCSYADVVLLNGSVSSLVDVIRQAKANAKFLADDNIDKKKTCSVQ